MDIDEAVKACRESQYTGWQMVTFVQKYVNKYMRFSLDNTSDAPRTAFSKGKGYSWQQAWCVQYILKKVNIRSELVYTTKADFYESRSKRQKIREGAHVWCRVRLNDTVKDVCSCNKENVPGDVNFVPVAPVRRYNLIAQAGGYLGVAILNKNEK